MVDFDNESTITTPASEIVKILILQRRYDLFEAVEKFQKQKAVGTDPDISLLKSRLYTLYLEVQSALKRKLKKEDYNILREKILSDSETTLFEAVDSINDFLDSIRLTVIDTRKVYDSTRVETENRAKGL